MATRSSSPKPRRKLETVSREQAESAVRTLLLWAGDDPKREGLLDTPKRVVNAYREWFAGYDSDPAAYLQRTFKEVAGYDEMIVLNHIVNITWRRLLAVVMSATCHPIK